MITANQAQYQGSGTINGAGNYGLLVTALNNGGGSTPDDIRLKIWDKNNNNAVVYDTQPGAPNTALPTTALGGGRIQVHSSGGGGAAQAPAKPGPNPPLGLILLPDALFARGLQATPSPAASQAQPHDFPTPGSVALPLTARQADALFAARQPHFARNVVRWAGRDQGMADAGQAWLADGLLDQARGQR